MIIILSTCHAEARGILLRSKRYSIPLFDSNPYIMYHICFKWIEKQHVNKQKYFCKGIPSFAIYTSYRVLIISMSSSSTASVLAR